MMPFKGEYTSMQNPRRFLRWWIVREYWVQKDDQPPMLVQSPWWVRALFALGVPVTQEEFERRYPTTRWDR